MAKLLTVFPRAALLLLGACSLLALVVSNLHATRSISLPLSTTKVDAITTSSSPDHPADQTRCYLIDPENSRCLVVPLLPGNRWGQLSVSPWCDADGNTEAVCQSFSSPGGAAGRSFWGLARLRVPEGEVIEEFKLDLLPTGRACWVPAHPGRILFAAGDGQLYLHDFPGWSSDGEIVTDAAARSNVSALCQVSWEGPPPIGESVFITDPVWPRHPRLRHLVFATAIPQFRKPQQAVTQATEIVWLLMSDEGAEVKASGLLGIPTEEASGDCVISRRFPNLEQGQDGTIRLAYLSTGRQDRTFRLKVVPIEIDSKTGHPRVPTHCLPRVLDEDCAPVPPLFSADGMSVYMESRSSGQILKRRVETDSPDKIHVARSG